MKDETDQVVSQLRWLQLDQSDFTGTDYENYLKLVQDDSLLFNDLPRIDEVWSPIIKNKRYSSLGKLLKAVLSFFHSTATAEGSIKDIRNILGSLSHSSSDKMCTSRLSLMTAVRSSSSKCCYDYPITDELRKNWRSSWKGSKDDDDEEASIELRESGDEDYW